MGSCSDGVNGMIYVTSDLHGYPLEKFQNMLDAAGFTDEDFLFVLGDVIDRGPEGAELLLWLTQQPNVQLILGNHEALLLACRFLFEEATEDRLDALTTEKLALVQNWVDNGGSSTMQGLRKILKRDPDLLEGIMEYLLDAPLFEWVDVDDRRFLLVHAGLENFSPHRDLEDYDPRELLLARPGLDTAYFGDAVVVFGHTPTEIFGEAYKGRAVQTDSWICIDTGAGWGGAPMLLRLDDGKTYYVDGE